MGGDINGDTNNSTRLESGGQRSPAARRSIDSLDLYADGISPERVAFDRRLSGSIERLALFVNDHWLWIFNAFNAIVFLGAFAVPLLAALGLNAVARPIFDAYKIICVQNPDHSYFILGYQMAMDQRMTAIAGAGVAAGLVFALGRQKISPLDWRLYVLLLLPMAVDGFTQLFGWRHSNWELRTLTGGLFGVATVWLAYPYLQAEARKVSEHWRAN